MGKKPIGWEDILALARDKKGWSTYGFPQWGSFKFGHTHPAYSNSGIISLIAENYAATGKVRGLTIADVQSPKTRAFVSGIENSVVHYGSSTGFFGPKLFDSGPEYLSAAVLYESMVVESYAKVSSMPFPVVAIYPREGTFWSDHPVGIVNRPWVTPERQEAAQIYIRYLLGRPQQEKAMTYGFRPGSPDVAVGPPIDAAHGVDPRQPTTTLEVPSFDVIAALQQQWDTQETSRPTSCRRHIWSMSEEERCPQPRQAPNSWFRCSATRMTVPPFSATWAWASKDEPLSRSAKFLTTRADLSFPRARLRSTMPSIRAMRTCCSNLPTISGPWWCSPTGKTTRARKLSIILLAKIHPDAETHTIRIFTIAYGQDARRDVLQQMADATQGKSLRWHTEKYR